MRVIVQRTTRAQVSVDNKVVGQITQGLLLLVGISATDTEKEVDAMVKKIAGLRIFRDADDKMNLSVIDITGAILSISQFTLYADCKKGNRPSFIQAARPEKAQLLYNYFNTSLTTTYNLPVQTGIFGAHMEVDFVNDGPVTIILDSDAL